MDLFYANKNSYTPASILHAEVVSLPSLARTTYSTRERMYELQTLQYQAVRVRSDAQ